MKTMMTRRLGLQIMAAAAVATPAAATTAPNPDAELIELGRRFVELSRLRDAASEEAGRLVAIGADDTAAAKMKIMGECGIDVVQSPADIGKTIANVMKPAT